MIIVLFSPAYKDNHGNKSINLGDLIIDARIAPLVKELFPEATVQSFSTHTPPTAEEMRSISRADLVLVGGTNLLSSDVQAYNQWKLGKTPHLYMDVPLADVVLCGVGWWQYQDAPTTVTKYFYRQLLSGNIPHSVRDSYTAEKMRAMGIDNVVNTSCPTLWALNGYDNRKKSAHGKCLATITDYHPDPRAYNELLEALVEHYPAGVTIFPQGDQDLRDVRSLDVFVRNQRKIELLPHDLSLFCARVAKKDADYVGTRLHAGAYCMEHGLDSLIVGVDNRSLEIAKDINLPVVMRGDMDSLKRWLAGERVFAPIKLPLAEIAFWKEEVRKRVGEVLEEKARRKGAARGKTTAPHRPARKLLNLGCGGRLHDDWTNVDFTVTGPGVIAHDLLQPLPFPDNSFHAVYHSHVLEHMPKRYAPEFLHECWRVLQPEGILRVVIPDLELAVQDYLRQLYKAKGGDRTEIMRLEYLTISLLDQLTRHRPGGELLNYWKQNPMPDEDFVVTTHGVEVIRSLAVLRDLGAPDEYRRAETRFDPKNEHSAKRIGQFRVSGEAHLWMYDSVSLKELLLQAGFTTVRLCRADESDIPDFDAYHLDVMSDGSVAKPESLFMEGRK